MKMVPLFEALADEELESLMSRVPRRHFKDHKVILLKANHAVGCISSNQAASRYSAPPRMGGHTWARRGGYIYSQYDIIL